MRLGNHDDDITDESIPPKSHTHHTAVKAHIPTPQLHSGHTLQLPSGHTPQLHSGHTPQLQGASLSGSHTHQLSSSHAPQFPSDHTPQLQTPSDYTHQIPSGHTPQLPSGHTHQLPSGHTPQLPSGHTPQIPSGHTPSDHTPLVKQLELDQLLKDQASSQATPTLPTYNESMRAPSEHMSPPTQLSPAHAYHKRYQEIRQRLERLKQQQVYYHQSGATPQQWYQLQVQQQLLLQQQNQIQQWIMTNEQTRQMELEKKKEDERINVLENRRRAEEGERGRERGGWVPVRDSDSTVGHAQLPRQQDQGSPHPHGYNQQQTPPLLWKPIAQTTTSPQYQSFHPTPPLSQSPPTNPSPHVPLSRQSPNLTSLMKTTPLAPPTHSEVRSRYAMPSSSGHTYMGTPPRPQLGSAGMPSPQTHPPITPRQAEDPLGNPDHRPHPQLMMVQTPNAYQLPSNQSVPKFINETEAILRQQEYQKRLLQQQQLLMQQQMRQNQDPSPSFILQQGMIPMGIPQTGFVQQFENPNVGMTRGIAQTGHPTAAMVIQQGHTPNVYPPTQSAVIHPGGNTTKNLSFQQQMKFQ